MFYLQSSEIIIGPSNDGMDGILLKIIGFIDSTRSIEIVPKGGPPFLVDGIPFWLMKSRGRSPFG